VRASKSLVSWNPIVFYRPKYYAIPAPLVLVNHIFLMPTAVLISCQHSTNTRITALHRWSRKCTLLRKLASRSCTKPVQSELHRNTLFSDIHVNIFLASVPTLHRYHIQINPAILQATSYPCCHPNSCLITPRTRNVDATHYEAAAYSYVTQCGFGCTC
jgi:hypothetical protein